MNALNEGLGVLHNLVKADELFDLIDAIRQIELDETWLKTVRSGDFEPAPPQIDRRGRTIMKNLKLYYRTGEGDDAKLYRLIKDDMGVEQRRVMLAAMSNKAEALAPVASRRGGQGYIEIRQFNRGNRLYGPYAYLRVWETGGDIDRTGSRLKSYYLGRDFAEEYIDGKVGIEEAREKLGL